jgi:predicted AlkP superfamily pyrophosphatase or phosphodiesterase
MKKLLYLFFIAMVFVVNTIAKDNKKVLLIGVDGFTNRLIEKTSMPNLKFLIKKGTVNRNAKLTKDSKTLSAPGWATILKGILPSKHTVYGNSIASIKKSKQGKYLDILSAIEKKDSTLETFAVYDWDKLPYLFSSKNIDSNQLVKDDKTVLNIATKHLMEDKADVSFVYFMGLDVVGHVKGRGKEYLAYMTTMDEYLGKLISSIRKRKNYRHEHWLIAFCTDHGMDETGNHGKFSHDEITTIYLLQDNKGYVLANKTLDKGSNVDYFTTIWYHLFKETRKDLDGSVTGYLR